MIEFLRAFFGEFLPAIWLAMSAETNSFITWLRPRARRLWTNVKIILGVILGLPVLAVILDLIAETGWITALTGLITAIALGAILIQPIYPALALLIGALWAIVNLRISFVPKTAIEFGEKYLKAVAAILLWELIIIFYLSIVPVWQNPKALPLVALSAFVAILMAYVWDFKGRFFKGFALFCVVAVLVIKTLSFYYPLTSEAINEKTPKIDETMAEYIRHPPTKVATPSKVVAAPRRVSKIIEVPALKEASTEIYYQAGDIIYYTQVKAEPKEYWIIGEKEDLKVTSRKYGTRATIGGEIILRGGPEPTKVQIQLSPKRSL